MGFPPTKHFLHFAPQQYGCLVPYLLIKITIQRLSLPKPGSTYIEELPIVVIHLMGCVYVYERVDTMIEVSVLILVLVEDGLCGKYTTENYNRQ